MQGRSLSLSVCKYTHLLHFKFTICHDKNRFQRTSMRCSAPKLYFPRKARSGLSPLLPAVEGDGPVPPILGPARKKCSRPPPGSRERSGERNPANTLGCIRPVGSRASRDGGKSPSGPLILSGIQGSSVTLYTPCRKARLAGVFRGRFGRSQAPCAEKKERPSV